MNVTIEVPAVGGAAANEVLRALGALARGGWDIHVEVSLDHTRWQWTATRFTAGWDGAPAEDFALVVLGLGACWGRAHPLDWVGPLFSNYVGEKFQIDRSRDRCDLTRLLGTFFGRDYAFSPADAEAGAYTERAQISVARYTQRPAMNAVEAEASRGRLPL